MSVAGRTPPGEGWLPWIDEFRRHPDSPYNHDMVEAWRPEWDEPMVFCPRKTSPYFNVDGLFWRPAQKTENPAKVRAER